MSKRSHTALGRAATDGPDETPAATAEPAVAGHGTQQDAAPTFPAAAKLKESKRERFLRIAPRRMTKALKVIYQVRNLGNRSTYEYTNEERLSIIKALAAAVDEVAQSFDDRPTRNGEFTF